MVRGTIKEGEEATHKVELDFSSRPKRSLQQHGATCITNGYRRLISIERKYNIASSLDKHLERMLIVDILTLAELAKVRIEGNQRILCTQI